PVDLGGRTRRDLLDHHAALLAGRHLEPDFAEKGLRRELELSEICLDALGQFLHAVIEARNGHAAVLVVPRAQDLRQHATLIPRGATVHAEWQIAVRAARSS